MSLVELAVERLTGALDTTRPLPSELIEMPPMSELDKMWRQAVRRRAIRRGVLTGLLASAVIYIIIQILQIVFAHTVQH